MLLAPEIPKLKVKNILAYEFGFINNLFAKSVGQFDKLVPLNDEGNSYLHQLEKRAKSSELTTQLFAKQMKEHLDNKNIISEGDENERCGTESNQNQHEKIDIPKPVKPLKTVKNIEKKEHVLESAETKVLKPHTDASIVETEECKASEELLSVPNKKVSSSNEEFTPFKKQKEETFVAKRKLNSVEEPVAKKQKIDDKIDASRSFSEPKSNNQKKKEDDHVSQSPVKPINKEPSVTTGKKKKKLAASTNNTNAEGLHSYSEEAQIRKRIAETPRAHVVETLLNPVEKQKTLEEVCLDKILGSSNKEDAAKLEMQHRQYIMNLALQAPSSVSKKPFISHDEIKIILSDDQGLKARATKIMGQILKRVQTQSEAIHHLNQMNAKINAGKYSYLTRKQTKILKSKIDRLLKEYHRAKSNQNKQKDRNRLLTAACDNVMQQAKRVALLEHTGQHHEAARQLGAAPSRRVPQQQNGKKQFHKNGEKHAARRQAWQIRNLPKKRK